VAVFYSVFFVPFRGYFFLCGFEKSGINPPNFWRINPPQKWRINPPQKWRINPPQKWRINAGFWLRMGLLQRMFRKKPKFEQEFT